MGIPRLSTKMHRNCHTRVNHCTFQQVSGGAPETPEKRPENPTKSVNPVQEAPFPGEIGCDRRVSQGFEDLYTHLAHQVRTSRCKSRNARSGIGATQAREGTSEMDPSCLGHPYFSSQP